MRDYNPIPIDTTKVQLPRDLYSLMEELSKSNHDTWSMHRIAEGWTYGPNRDDSKKEHPCIVPYEELPEIEKDYDRNTSGETLKAIYKLGFAITKRTTGNILVVGSYSSEEQKKLREVAKHYELTLCFYNDWESASNVLERDLSKWSAIILDTKAKLQTSEEATEFFLRNVLDDLTAVFNRNRNEIPWFIMPKEYDDFTDALIKKGVPMSAIIQENKSGHTRDNAFLSRQVIDEKGIEIKTAIIVCKAFHARRCLMLYQMAFPNVDIKVCPVYCYNITKENWYQTEYGTDRVLGELTRCGNQFVGDIKDYLIAQEGYRE